MYESFDPDQNIHRTRGKIQSRLVALAAMSLLAVAPLILASPASASGKTIGSYTFTGQVAGTLKAPEQFSGIEGLPTYACQVQQENTQILLQLSKEKLVVNGHKASLSNLQITASVPKDGVSEQISSGGSSEVTLVIAIGKKNSEWQSTSGTVTIKPKGNGATFSAGLVPAGTLSGNAIQSGGATKAVHLSGSVSSCHPFRQ
jgi:hypothetical protein